MLKKLIKRKIENLLIGEKYPYKKYCDKHKCIFIHIPKNAGTSIINLLNSFKAIEQEHNTYWDYLRADYQRYCDFDKFCVVRNPWDRLFSAYKYLSTGGNGNSDKNMSQWLNAECGSFEEFVLTWLTADKIYNIKVLMPQFVYIYDFHNQKMAVENLLRFESLNDDFLKFQKKLDIPGELPWVNKSYKTTYKDHYTQKMIDRVADLYSRDIALLDYAY
jgi:hypothetical protein